MNSRAAKLTHLPTNDRAALAKQDVWSSSPEVARGIAQQTKEKLFSGTLALNLSTASIVLVLLACTLTISLYQYFGHTWDEPEHIAAGMQLIDKGIYTYDIQHPPLARVAMALGPYLEGARSFGEPGPSGEQEGRDLLYRTGKYDQLLTLARLGTLPFLVILLGATWLWARRFFGLPEAVLAVFLLAATPPIIGHAALATLDIPVTALCTLALYFLLRWFENPSLKRGVTTGCIAGLAVGTKLSAIPFITIVGVIWAIAWMFTASVNVVKRHLKSVQFWLSAVTMVVATLLLATLCYGFTFKYLVDAEHPINTALNFLTGSNGIVHDAVYALTKRLPLPVGTERLIWSIQSLLSHNHAGHLSYLFGKTNQTGWWDFYLIALGVKTPLPFLVAALGGLFFLVWRAYRLNSDSSERREAWKFAAPTLAFVTLLLFCSGYSHINIGVRHVFVLYPLMAIAAAAGSLALWRSVRQTSACWAVHATLVALLIWQASTMWMAYPDYLPYFNPIAGDKPEKILIDSDLDWGQDLKRLEHRLADLHINSFGFVYRGSADLNDEHLPGVKLVPPFTPITGWIAASLYAKATVANGKAFAWLDNYLPVERIGKSIDLYCIPVVDRHPDTFDCTCLTLCPQH